MMLSPKIKREFKQQAHHLHPVIIIGQHGLTPAVIAETDLALKAHELIKVKINSADREERAAIGKELCTATQADLLQSIGSMVVLYRANPKETKPEIVKAKKVVKTKKKPKH